MATRTWSYVSTGCLCFHDAKQWGRKLLSNLTRVINLWFWRHLILSVPTRQTFQASYGPKTVDNLTRGTQTCAQNGGSKNQKMGVTLSCLWLDHRSFCPENPLTLRRLLRDKWLKMSHLSKGIIGVTFSNVSVIAIKTKKEHLLEKCCSIQTGLYLARYYRPSTSTLLQQRAWPLAWRWCSSTAEYHELWLHSLQCLYLADLHAEHLGKAKMKQ